MRRTAIVLALVMLSSPAVGMAEELLPVIPKPAKMERVDGLFRPTNELKIVAENRDLLPIARQLTQAIHRQTGGELPVVQETAGKTPFGIVLTSAGAKAELGKEGYELAVSPEAIVLRAPKPAGLFYGVQTIRQMLRRVDGSATAVWAIPCVRIEDRPRFAWRGMHLDVARHFFDKQFVKQTGKLTALSAVAGLAVPAVHASEDNTIRLAIIGCGPRGSGAVGNALSAPGGPVKLVAMASKFLFCPDIEKANENTPAPVTADAQGRYPAPIPGDWVEL